jgi:plasmid stabilization system protein ParE
MTHWLHPEAEKELGDAAEYYLRHANLQIAEAFLAEYERVRDLVIENQYRPPLHAHELRQCHFERFPYTLIYEANEKLGPQIFAVAHQRREPRYWQGRT